MPKLYPGYREEIRKKIVSEAFAVFLAKGFEKTTMDDIAARLGVTKPAIYRYYKNKEELFIAAGAEAMIEEFRQVFTTSFSSGDLITGAGLFFDGHVAIHHKYAAVAKDIESILSRDRSLHESIAGIHEEGQEFMLQFFRDQKRLGTIRTPLSETELAVLCGALMFGLMNAVGSGMDPAEAKRLWLLGFEKIAGIRTGKSSGKKAAVCEPLIKKGKD
jgi:AcrR family transcriptional regulator